MHKWISLYNIFWHLWKNLDCFVSKTALYKIDREVLKIIKIDRLTWLRSKSKMWKKEEKISFNSHVFLKVQIEIIQNAERRWLLWKGGHQFPILFPGFQYVKVRRIFITFNFLYVICIETRWHFALVLVVNFYPSFHLEGLCR